MPDSDPENYSLDDMLSRLRSQGDHAADGEERLVTRPDGTQVVKVRKRKRRSHQPHKEEELKRRKRSLVFAGLISFVVVALALGIFGWVLYLNGSSYREEVLTRVEQWTGAEVEMRSFRATPVSAAADLMVLTWPESSPAARMKLQGIRGDVKLTSHLTGSWDGETMTASAGELVLRAAPANESGPEKLIDGKLPFLAPMRVSRLNVVFGDGERRAMGLYETRASMSVPDPALPVANIICEGGRVRIGKWGEFQVSSAAMSLLSGGARLGNLRLTTEAAPQASIRMSDGTHPDLAVRGGTSTLDLELREAPSALVLGASLAGLIDATFETPEGDRTSRCEFDLTDIDSIKIAGQLKNTRSTPVKLYRLQMFNVLAEVMDNPRFTQPKFEKASTLSFARTQEEVLLSNINFDSDGMLRISGELREASGRLEGELDVGIPEILLAAAPSREVPLVFREARDDYRWCRVKLSGTTKAPTDDLSAQFQAAREGSSPVSEGSRGLDDEFLDLTTPER